jgi:hypothetical protein
VFDLPKFRAPIVGALAVGLTLIGTHAATAATVRASTKCNSITQTQAGSKMDCTSTFTNGPRVKFQFFRTGNHVELRACAYGHRPKGYDTIYFEYVLNEAGKAQAKTLKLSSTCSLTGKKPVFTIEVDPGDRVTARSTLYWSGRHLTGGAYLDIIA